MAKIAKNCKNRAKKSKLWLSRLITGGLRLTTAKFRQKPFFNSFPDNVASFKTNALTTDRWTDGLMDTPSYRDARMHLKMIEVDLTID